jgi:hypothetical protein
LITSRHAADVGDWSLAVFLKQGGSRGMRCGKEALAERYPTSPFESKTTLALTNPKRRARKGEVRWLETPTFRQRLKRL